MVILDVLWFSLVFWYYWEYLWVLMWLIMCCSVLLILLVLLWNGKFGIGLLILRLKWWEIVLDRVVVFFDFLLFWIDMVLVEWLIFFEDGVIGVGWFMDVVREFFIIVFMFWWIVVGVFLFKLLFFWSNFDFGGDEWSEIGVVEVWWRLSVILLVDGCFCGFFFVFCCVVGLVVELILKLFVLLEELLSMEIGGLVLLIGDLVWWCLWEDVLVLLKGFGCVEVVLVEVGWFV